MPDICDLVLDDHETFRRRFAELDELRGNQSPPEALARVWGPLAELLEVHAAAEEEIFYPELLSRGDRGHEETEDAIGDHNEIRDAIRRASQAAPGSDAWWEAVLAAREANSTHLGEEEREAIPDFRVNAAHDLRDEMGGRWESFEAQHCKLQDVDVRNKDVDQYISKHS